MSLLYWLTWLAYKNALHWLLCGKITVTIQFHTLDWLTKTCYGPINTMNHSFVILLLSHRVEAIINLNIFAISPCWFALSLKDELSRTNFLIIPLLLLHTLAFGTSGVSKYHAIDLSKVFPKISAYRPFYTCPMILLEFKKGIFYS